MNTDRQTSSTRPLALTIAGLDPSGGAGVIADIRTFIALGCSPAAAITSVTFQNQSAVLGAEHLAAATVRAQVMPVITDCVVGGVKTGMLPTREIVAEVVRLFRETDLPAPVVDPVLRSTSGYALIDEDALEAMREELFPLARLLTPNIPEAERITGLRIVDEEGMRQAASAIRALGASAVLIKGGHLWATQETINGAGSSPGAPASRPPRSPKISDGTDLEFDQSRAGGALTVREAIDVLDDEGTVKVFRGEWIDGGNVRGTGCMLSAAIAACLARGMSINEAVAQAKRFVSERISATGV